MTDLAITGRKGALRGTLRVPADKSITHRALMLAPLGEGESRIENYLDSETTRATLNCLRAMGAEIEALDATTLRVQGRGLHSLQEPRDVLYCLGSGTTMRLLAGLCAGQPFLSILDGTAALKRRPMARVAEPLRAMGATILARENDRLPPLVIRGSSLHGIDYTLPVASAQVKSAILLAGLFADAPTVILEPAPSRDHTERMLRALGVGIESETDLRVKMSPRERLETGDLRFTVPGDFSSAAFLLVAALLVPRSEICLEGVGINHTRIGLLDALGRMGADVTMENQRAETGEPMADLVVRSTDGLKATDVGGDQVPRMIDEFPILAVAATQAEGETHVRDAAELRVKESDRVASVTNELRKMGAQIEPQADGFVIAGLTPLRGARVHSHNDHRLAMSLAVAALIADGETTIEGWEYVADSFPGFQEMLERLIIQD